MKVHKVKEIPQWIISSNKAAYHPFSRTIWITRWKYLPHELLHYMADRLHLNWLHYFIDHKRWISVDVELPKEAESVLVTWFRPSMVKPVIMCGHYIADPGELTWFRDWTAEIIKPTHWMPLPAPPIMEQTKEVEG